MEDSWERFELTGKVEDYLRYRQQEQQDAIVSINGCDSGFVISTERSGGYSRIRRDTQWGRQWN